MDTVHNDYLERSMRSAGLTPKALAAKAGTVEKTVRRWLRGQTTPYLTNQYAIAAALNVDREALWPDSPDAQSPLDAPDTDLVTLYPGRSDVPPDLWTELAAARGDIELLSNDLNWFTDAHPAHVEALILRAHSGGRVNLALLDPDGIDTTSSTDALEDAALSRRSLRQFDALLHVDRAVHSQIRLHPGSRLTILRFADDMLVQPVLDGVPAALAPVLHLRRATEAGAFNRYLAHLQHVWAHASLVPKHHRDLVAAKAS
ncbi:MAG: DUF5919 domain-containing protein [Mycobacteriales bacterium]